MCIRDRISSNKKLPIKEGHSETNVIKNQVLNLNKWSQTVTVTVNSNSIIYISATINNVITLTPNKQHRQ